MSILAKKTRHRDAPLAERPQHPFASLHREMDRLFADFLGTMETPLPLWTEGGFPLVNVCETRDALRITAELPGMDAGDVEVRIEGGALVIAGEKTDEKEEHDERLHWHRRERVHGSFRRVVHLPAEADLDHVDATFRKGVLEIRLPLRKEAEAPAKTIAVKDGD